MLWCAVQAERLADMTDLERNFEKAQARLAELQESLEAAEAQVRRASCSAGLRARAHRITVNMAPCRAPA